MPGLDGIRALAVLAVIAYHVNFGWAQGGLLGVGVFFTLSGYLITDLLLAQWDSTGHLRLADFWLRRARRLLPALFVMLTAITAWVTLADRAQIGAIRRAVAAAVLYVSNWWLIAQHMSYFARFGPPSPLGHLWSLAVEEQFYLLWPWLLLLGLVICRRRTSTAAGRRRFLSRSRSLHGRPRSRRGWLVAATLALAAASGLAMAMLYRPGYDPTRVYDGTDTRAFALLAGAALAMVWPSRRAGAGLASRWRRWVLEGAGTAGLGVFAFMVWRTSEYSAFLYRGGIVLLAVVTAVVIAAVVHPGSPLGKTLGWGPLRWIGVRSYGIYLWHYPVIVLTSPAAGRDSLPRAAAQIGASICLAALSWRFIELPIRHGALGHLWSRARVARWRLSADRRAWLAATGALCVLSLAGASLGGVLSAGSVSAVTGGVLGPASLGVRVPPAGGASGAQPPGQSSTTGLVKRQNQSSCTSVVHIGDSTSEGMVSASYLPDREQRMAPQYARVGVTTTHLNISGARSIVETLPGQVNAYTVARRLVRAGYHGCWVLALGTNDTADVVVGSPVSRMARIQRMMSVIGKQPVMWVNVKSLLTSGPYAESYMAAWDAALVQACARYPNMRVFDWAAKAKPGWFISDGIHYTSVGYAARSRLIAGALARAFPAVGPRSGCVVH
jgi:peptidoglycan/LPS O-acetylase OafA/YrhL